MSAPAIRVLIVDDNADLRTILWRVLGRQEDIEVVAAVESGEQACEAATRMMPDVVLMDVRMRGMGGVEAALWLASHLPQVSVVGISALEEADPAVEAMREARVAEFVPKLASIDRLVHAVRLAAAAGRLKATTRAAHEAIADPLDRRRSPTTVATETKAEEPGRP